MSGRGDTTPELTKNQALVLEALAGAGQPLGAYALLMRFAITASRHRFRFTGRSTS